MGALHIRVHKSHASIAGLWSRFSQHLLFGLASFSLFDTWEEITDYGYYKEFIRISFLLLNSYTHIMNQNQCNISIHKKKSLQPCEFALHADFAWYPSDRCPACRVICSTHNLPLHTSPSFYHLWVKTWESDLSLSTHGSLHAYVEMPRVWRGPIKQSTKWQSRSTAFTFSNDCT